MSDIRTQMREFQTLGDVAGLLPILVLEHIWASLVQQDAAQHLLSNYCVVSLPEWLRGWT